MSKNLTYLLIIRGDKWKFTQLARFLKVLDFKTVFSARIDREGEIIITKPEEVA